MSASTTDVSIVNMAMKLIGQRKIQDLGENTAQGNAANVFYQPSLEDVLRAFDWPFARVVRVLVAITDYSSINWTYGYTHPSNALIVRSVYAEDTVDKIIGERFDTTYDPDLGVNVIVTDTINAYGAYTYLLTDPTLYDASFVIAFSHNLAAKLAMPLNGDKPMAETQLSIFNGIISEAERKADKQAYKPRTPVSSFVSARA